MAANEDEVSRKARERRKANAAIKPERPGTAATVGRLGGAAVRGVREGFNAAMSGITEGGLAVGRGLSEGGRRLAEGASAGNEGRAIDTSGFNPGEGTTDKTLKRPGGLIESERSLGEGGAVGINQSVENFAKNPPFPGAFDQAVESSSAEGLARGTNTRQGEFPGKLFDPAQAAASGVTNPNIPRPELPNVAAPAPAQAPAAAPSLANSGKTQPAPRPDFNRTGDLKDLPEGFTQLIKGTQVGFQDAGGSQFKSVPGQSPEQSRDTAARRDPAFNVQTNEDLERGRINAQTITAESNRLNAQGNNRFQGIDPETGEFGIFQMDANGNVQPTGVAPIVDSIVNGDQDFSVETVNIPSEIPGVSNERQIRLNKADGTFFDITEVIRQEIGAAAFTKLRQTNPDASVEELIEQAEQSAGGPLPQLRAAFAEQ